VTDNEPRSKDPVDIADWRPGPLGVNLLGDQDMGEVRTDKGAFAKHYDTVTKLDDPTNNNDVADNDHHHRRN
jgi:hypothetical protein